MTRTATSPSNDAIATTASLSNVETEIEDQDRRRNEVIALDSGNGQCLVTSELSSPNSNDGTAMGLMFTVETVSDFVEIQTLEFYANKTEQTNNVEVTVYTRSGFFIGFEEQASEWTQIASASVTLAPEGKPTIIPEAAFQPVNMEPNSRQSFYITLNTTTLHFSNVEDASVSVGSSFLSDDFISLSTGVSLSDVFIANTRHQKHPRLLNGALYYSRRLSCMQARKQSTMEFNYLLKTPSEGVVLTPISDVVRKNVESLINPNTTSSLYGSKDMLTLDDVRSQAALVQGTCPNGWRSCFQLTTQVALSYMDYPTLGKVIYDTLSLQPQITAGITQAGFSVDYNGATPLSYNYSFFLNGVPNNSNLDDVEVAYFERVALQFLQDSLQNATSATVLAVQVESQGGGNAASSNGLGHLRERHLQQSTPPTGVLQIMATIYGLDQLPDALAPLDQALVEIFDTKSEDFTYDLSSGILKPGTISQAGEGNVFAQLFGVRAVDAAVQNQTGYIGPSSTSASDNHSKILGLPAIWFAVLCIGVILVMMTWLTYIYVHDKREFRQWRRLARREERRKKKRKGSPCREDSDDVGSDDGLLATDKGYSTEGGWTAAESFDTTPLYDSSPERWDSSTRLMEGRGDVEMQNDSSNPKIPMPLVDLKSATEESSTVPAVVGSTSMSPKKSQRELAIQTSQRQSQIKAEKASVGSKEATKKSPCPVVPAVSNQETQEQPSNVQPRPRSPLPTLTKDTTTELKTCEDQPSLVDFEKSPRKVTSKKMEQKSPQRERSIGSMSSPINSSHRRTEELGTHTLPDVDPESLARSDQSDVKPRKKSASKSPPRTRIANTKPEKTDSSKSLNIAQAAFAIEGDESIATKNKSKSPPRNRDRNATSDTIPTAGSLTPALNVKEPGQQHPEVEVGGAIATKTKSKSKSPPRNRDTKKSKSKSPPRNRDKGTNIDTSHPRPPPSRSDEEEPSELELVQAQVTRSPPPTTTNKKASSPKPGAAPPPFKLDDILPMLPNSESKQGPSELDEVRARVIGTEPPAATTTSKAVLPKAACKEVPQGSMLKAKEVFDRKELPNKPDPPTPLPLDGKENKDAFTKELMTTLQSTTDFGELRDRFTKITIPIGKEKELLDVLLLCCAREPSYEKRYGQLAEHLSTTLQLRWKRTLEPGFTDVMNNIGRFTLLKNITSRNTPIRNVAKFFAHLLHSECIPWSVLRVLHEEQQDTSNNTITTAESRLFIKTLVQQVAKVQRRDGDTTDDDVSRDGTTISQSDDSPPVSGSDEEQRLHMDNARAA